MPIKLTNNAISILPTAISSTATSITVGTGDGSKFPILGATDFFYLTLVDTNNNIEVVKVTARAGDTMTVVRAQEGTLAIGFPIYSRAELRITAANLLALL